MIKVEKMSIVSQKQIAKNVFELILEGNLANYINKSGQFLNIKVNDYAHPILRRPISICDVDKNLSQIKIIYKKIGEGTKLLSLKKEKEVVDVLGILGNGFDIDEVSKTQTVLLVGGGIGVPPLYKLCKDFYKKQIKVISVLGFNSKDEVFYEQNFKKFSQTYIATMDGSYGFFGNVCQLIDNKNIQFDWIFACGPKPMLVNIDKRYSKTKKGYLSLEERMACGIGACYACVCKLKDGSTKTICKNGPVFKLGEVLI